MLLGVRLWARIRILLITESITQQKNAHLQLNTQRRAVGAALITCVPAAEQVSAPTITRLLHISADLLLQRESKLRASLLLVRALRSRQHYRLFRGPRGQSDGEAEKIHSKRCVEQIGDAFPMKALAVACVLTRVFTDSGAYRNRPEPGLQDHFGADGSH